MDEDKELRAVKKSYDELVSTLEAALSKVADEQIKALAAQMTTPRKELFKQDPTIFLRGKFIGKLLNLRGELKKLEKLLAKLEVSE